MYASNKTHLTLTASLERRRKRAFLEGKNPRHFT
jgi:hypothetical protein